jgi:hypothetical protein
MKPRSQSLGTLDNTDMATMNAVKIADRDHGAGQAGRKDRWVRDEGKMLGRSDQEMIRIRRMRQKGQQAIKFSTPREPEANPLQDALAIFPAPAWSEEPLIAQIVNVLQPHAAAYFN